MTIRSVSTNLSIAANGNVNNIVINQPGAGGTWVRIRVSNYSNFPATVIGVGGDPGSNPYYLAPLQQDVYTFQGTASGTVQLLYGEAASTVAGMYTSVEFADDPNAFAGYYPAILNAPAAVTFPGTLDVVVTNTVDVTGSVVADSYYSIGCESGVNVTGGPYTNNFGNVVGGKLIASSGVATISAIDPSTGLRYIICNVNATSGPDVDTTMFPQPVSVQTGSLEADGTGTYTYSIFVS